MSLQMQFDAEEKLDIDEIEDSVVHEAELKMSEEVELCTFAKTQVFFVVEKIGNWKSY